jgi:hypothetical protein
MAAAKVEEAVWTTGKAVRVIMRALLRLIQRICRGQALVEIAPIILGGEIGIVRDRIPATCDRSVNDKT